MLIIISPAKTQDFARQRLTAKYSEPELLHESEKLIRELKKKSEKKVADLMNISEKLAALNVERYHNFTTPFTRENSKQAMLAFKGDVYTDIAVEDYSPEEFDYAQQHVRILSGLYGLLKPLDLIQPYRLEMKTKLKNPRGRDLYRFWGDRITRLLNKALEEQENPVLVNLASREYFKAVNSKKLKADIITPVFKDYQNGTYRIIAFYAKKARGMMTNFAVKNRVEDVQELKAFGEAGYAYDESRSTDKEWVFIR